MTATKRRRNILKRGSRHLLGREDLNPQRLDQNQLCYQLHHARLRRLIVAPDMESATQISSLFERRLLECAVDLVHCVVFAHIESEAQLTDQHRTSLLVQGLFASGEALVAIT